MSKEGFGMKSKRKNFPQKVAREGQLYRAFQATMVQGQRSYAHI